MFLYVIDISIFQKQNVFFFTKQFIFKIKTMSKIGEICKLIAVEENEI